MRQRFPKGMTFIVGLELLGLMLADLLIASVFQEDQLSQV